MNRRIGLWLTSVVVLAGAIGCRHEREEFAVDQELYRRALGTEASIWYKFDDALLPRSSQSGHGEAFLRTRYNAPAATVLDSMGKVIPGSTFPNGALIVKELWPDASGLGTYAVMLKRPTDRGADADGWVWGYIRSNGMVRESAIDQGAACRGCHSQSGHIDRTLMTKYFP
jgi:hypothetical protein